MESTIVKSQPNNMSSFFGKISESTRSNPATNVAQLKTTCSRINVRGKIIDFNRKEEIFQMQGPTSKKYTSDQCNLCEKELKGK